MVGDGLFISWQINVAYEGAEIALLTISDRSHKWAAR